MKKISIIFYFLIPFYLINCNNVNQKYSDNYDVVNFKFEKTLLVDSVSGTFDSIFTSNKIRGLTLLKSYNNDKVRGIMFLFFDEKHGSCSTFYTNGNKMYEGIYSFGIKTGVHKYYYENGKNYFDEFYDKNGNFIKKVNYDTLINSKSIVPN